MARAAATDARTLSSLRRLSPLALAASGVLLVAQGKVAFAQGLAPSPPTSLAHARQLLATNRFAEAEAEVRLTLHQQPDSADAHYLLAYTLLRERRARESLAEYTEAARLQHPTAADLRNVANAYALLADYPDAEHWMRQSLAADPANPDIWYNFGRVLFSEQRFADALAAFQHARTLRPGSSKIQNNIGLALEGLNRGDEAIIAYREAIAAEREESPPPLSPEQPLLNLGIALLRRGDLSEAQPLLEEAAHLAPADPRIHEQLGQLLLDKHDLPGAERELRQALTLDPGNAALHFRLGQVLRRAGKQAEAEIELRRSAELLGTHSSPETP